jgi:acetyl esterase/lipase
MNNATLAYTFRLDRPSTKDLLQGLQNSTRDGQTIPIRVYRPRDAADTISFRCTFFHGGGYLFGTFSSEDANCARIVTALPIVAVSVCYRHTPFKHPTQYNDA